MGVKLTDIANIGPHSQVPNNLTFGRLSLLCQELIIHRRLIILSPVILQWTHHQ